MTDEEFARLRLIRAINPDIDPEELEKYFCMACTNFDCRADIDRFMKKRKVEQFVRFRIWQGKGVERIVDIYKCFEGDKND